MFVFLVINKWSDLIAVEESLLNFKRVILKISSRIELFLVLIFNNYFLHDDIHI